MTEYEESRMKKFWKENPEMVQLIIDKDEKIVQWINEERKKNGQPRLSEENALYDFGKRWGIIDAYFKEFGKVDSRIRSYNHFIKNLEKLDIQPIEVYCNEPQSPYYNQKHTFRFVDWRVTKPYWEDKSDQKTTIELALRPVGEISIPFPHEARIQNRSYRMQIKADIEHIVEDITPGQEKKELRKKLIRDVWVTDFPVMVKSDYCSLKDPSHPVYGDISKNKECPKDQGGYYIIEGTERVLIQQERIKYVFPFIFKKQQNSKKMLVAEVRSLHENSASTPTLILVKYKKMKIRNEKTLKLQFPYISYEYSINVIFRALGITSDREILLMCSHDLNDKAMIQLLIPSMKECGEIETQEQAWLEISHQSNQCTEKTNKEEIIRYAQNILNKNLFPHMGNQPSDWRNKGYFLGYMIKRLLEVKLKRRPLDDRDHYSNKRVDTDGNLNFSLLHHHLDKMSKEWKANYRKILMDGKPINVPPESKKKINNNKQIEWAFATGTWIVSKSPKPSKGVSDVFSRLSFHSSLSHSRRKVSGISGDVKIAKPRQFSAAQAGFSCMAETPEGASVGLVKNMALMMRVAIGESSIHVLTILYRIGMIPLSVLKEEQLSHWTSVFVNGNWYGMIKYAQDAYHYLIKKRRNMEINCETSIIFNRRERMLQIWTDSGRSLRPCLVVDNESLKMTPEILDSLQYQYESYYLENNNNNKPKHDVDKLKKAPFTFSQLVAQGYIEFIDPMESEESYIGMFPEQLEKDKSFTHIEIHPTTFYGVVANSIPFSNHNPASRNAFQSAMGKQVIGISCNNLLERMDTLSHLLWYPQRSMCTTRGSQTLDVDDFPSGQNAIVAIIPGSVADGDNQEDAINISQGSIDRGMYRSYFFRTYEIEQKQTQNYNRNTEDFELFEKPDPQECEGPRRGDDSLLTEDGIVSVGDRVTPGHILIGKTTKYTSKLDPRYTKKDTSILNRSHETGVVDKVVLTQKESGAKIAKVRIRSIRIPQKGDKFSSRHGQKGVVGAIIPQENMPWIYRDGTPIDMMINPNAIPSRMTIAHTIETLASIVGVEIGKFINATAFESCLKEKTVHEIFAHALRDLGYSPNGHETLVSGITGKMIQAQIFVGPVFYQKLRHMVQDKKHARAKGPVNPITKEPVEGRAKNGGLRFGEMEVNCLQARGAASTLQERMMTLSNETTIYVCEKCNEISYKNHSFGFYECPRCQRHDQISAAKIPHTLKVLIDELAAMTVDLKLKLKKD